MVSIREAILQIGQAREQVGEARGRLTEREREITEAEGKIGSAFFPGDIKTQLALASQPGVGVGGAGLSLKQERRSLQKRKEVAFGQIGQARQELIPFRQQLTSREQEISSFEQQVRRAEEIQLAFESGKPLGDISPSARAEIERIRRGRRQFKVQRAKELISELKPLEIKPKFTSGFSTLVGFESERAKQSFQFDRTGLLGLTIVNPQAVQKLADLGFVTLEKPESRIDTTTTSNILSSPSLKSQVSNVSLSPISPIISSATTEFATPILRRGSREKVRDTLIPGPGKTQLPQSFLPFFATPVQDSPEKFFEPNQSRASPIDLQGLGGTSFQTPSGGLPGRIEALTPNLLPPSVTPRGGADIQDVQESRLPTLEEVKLQRSIVSPVSQPTSFFGKLKSSAERFSSESQLKGLREGGLSINQRIAGVGASVSFSLLSAPGQLIQLGKGAITDPIGLTKSIPGGILKTGEEFGRKLGSPTPEIAFADITSEVLIFKGTGKLLKVGSTAVELSRARLTPKFRGISTRPVAKFPKFEEQFIGNLPQIGGTGSISLIPEGGTLGPRTIAGQLTPPTIRGPFGFPASEIRPLVGQTGTVTTSARDLFGFGKTTVNLKPGVGGIGLFGTPFRDGQAFTRVSRLGTAQPEATLGDILRGDFTFFREKPQIVTFPDETIGRKGGFQPKQFTPGELEVTLKSGVITKTGTPGVTIINRRRVPIITAKIGKGSPEIFNLQRRALGGESLTTFESFKLSRATGISSGFSSKPFVSPTRFGTSSLSVSRQLSGFSSRPQSSRVTSRGVSSGVSGRGFSSRVSARLIGSGTSGLGGSPRSSLGLSPRGFSGFSGLPGVSVGITGGGVPPPRVDFERRKSKKKRTPRKRLKKFRVAPSFTAQVVNLRGKFPKVKIKGLGLTPNQFRVLPLGK